MRRYQQNATAAGGAAEGTAAFLVLEAAKPWSRKTHRLFPAPARKRAVELRWVVKHLPITLEVWEAFVVPHEVARDYKPPQA